MLGRNQYITHRLWLLQYRKRLKLSDDLYALVLNAMYISLNLSNPANTPAPATPLRMFAPAPFIRDMNPSFLMTWTKQSIDPLYLTSPPKVIIIRLLTVSMG